MRSRIVSSGDFGKWQLHQRPGPTTHTYRAELASGAVRVFDVAGNRVQVTFASTADRRTAYARIEGVGFIGGWQHPHKALPFTALVDYINLGIVYQDMRDLPRSPRVKVCPHCAGIGGLARAALDRWEQHPWLRVVCVEINPDYVAVGKRVVPEAEWLQIDMREAEAQLAGLQVEQVVSNPPFGNVAGCKQAHYVAAEIAARLGRRGGVFIMPAGALPWRFSGRQGFEHVPNARYEKWSRESGVVLSPNCGVDTTPSLQEEPFHGTNPGVEICLVERATE